MCFIFLRRLFKKCIYLAALNLSHGMHVGSSVGAYQLLVVECGI